MAGLMSIKGIGENSQLLLSKIGISKPLDLLENIPRGYDDYSEVTDICQIKPGMVTLKGRISSLKKRYSKKGLHMTEALVSDSTGSVRIMWFNQPYRAQSIKVDQEYYLSGLYATNYKFLVLSNPTCELVSSFPLHTARLVPRYKLTKGLSAHQLRKFTKAAFDAVKVADTLPAWIRDAKSLMDRHSALFHMHFPISREDVLAAKRRIGFEELFEMVLASELNKIDFKAGHSLTIKIQNDEIKKFVDSLPYALTDDQRIAAWQILQDMNTGSPMNRLLQGDVGSGKTVVAAIALLAASKSGYQAALMAPTELLAAQHAKTLRNMISEFTKDEIVYLGGSLTVSEKKTALAAIENGQAKIVIGTHALLQSHVQFPSLSLAIIDEQHRFGVEQRKMLQGKAHVMPHILNMTATPIPRSIALTLYGDMDMTIIREKPAFRQPVRTKIIIPEERKKLYESLNSEISEGRQVFVVCPIIEESEKAGRSLHVEWIAKQIKSWIKDARVGLLHGKMTSLAKEDMMQSVVDGKIDVLVATTVIEVGVDVPNATTMIIEGADKFGLAQLHQLRGRVGRGEYAGTCYLVPTENDSIPQRLRVIETESDGFRLADYDLELRGPGAIYGTMQHGALDLRVAKITDTALIREARETAQEFIKRGENLVQYPELKKRVDRLRTITNLN